MKLVCVTGTFPYPPTDGLRIRIFSFLRTLAQRHHVTLASFITPHDDPHGPDRLREYGMDVHVVPRSPRYSPVTLTQGLLSTAPFPVLNYADERMTRLLRQLLERDSVDLVQAHSIHMAQYCLGLDVPTVLDLDNIESLLMKRYARRATHVLKRGYAEVTWRKLAAYERAVCRQFSQCLTCSDEDRILLQTCAGVERVSVVPNGVNLAHYSGWDTPKPAGGPRIVFIGRMDYHANVDGAQWFCREVLPRIHARLPGVLFQIVGGHPAPAVRRLATPERVEVTGFVPDTRPFLAGADAVVVPLRVGGGTRLKILEAMAMEKAVVSTSLGAEGIDAVAGHDLVLADDPDDFAAQVVHVLRDPALQRSLGQAGRRLAASKYDWDAIVKGLEVMYEWCVGTPSAQRTRIQPVA